MVSTRRPFNNITLAVANDNAIYTAGAAANDNDAKLPTSAKENAAPKHTAKHTAKSRQPLTDRTSCLSSVPPLISQSPSQSTAIVSFNDIAPCIEQSEEGEVIRGTVKRLKVGPTSSASVPTRARGYLDLSRDESAHKQRAKVLFNHLTETLAISPRKASGIIILKLEKTCGPKGHSIAMSIYHDWILASITASEDGEIWEPPNVKRLKVGPARSSDVPTQARGYQNLASATSVLSPKALAVTESEAEIDPEKDEKIKEMIEKMDAKRNRILEAGVSSSCCSTSALCSVFIS